MDSVLLRVPAGLRRRIVEKAKEHGLSQNGFITASMLYSAVVFGELPSVGVPTNAVTLFKEMSRAVAENDAVLHTIDERDWVDVRPIIELFAESTLVAGVKARRDPGSNRIAFTFHFTKTGAAAWEVFGPMFKGAADALDRLRAFPAA
ncbi:MAG TPA: hypothetical protein VMD91_08785 [Candidatus Sulfotelmatobacter sp.]|nr:hypothetical protein [Candidatus Sulfotelmatobacter sp.]